MNSIHTSFGMRFIVCEFSLLSCAQLQGCFRSQPNRRFFPDPAEVRD